MSVGAGQIILIVVAILLIFGAGRLPRIMEDLAKGIKSFKKGMADEGDQANEKLTDQPKIKDN